VSGVRVERDGDVLHAVLDDGDVGNVIGHEMAQGLMAAVEAVEAPDDGDPPVRCLLLTAAGENFCLGGDIRFFSQGTDEAASDVGHKIGALAQGLHVAMRRLRDVPVPLVTAVQGWPATSSCWRSRRGCGRVTSGSGSRRTVPCRGGWRGRWGRRGRRTC
jgi:enoyl-CoA hydratase/carnithine racemase